MADTQADSQSHPETISPLDIDAAYVPVPNPSVQEVAVGPDLVLLDGWQSASVVSPVGSLIWGSFDGHASVGQIAAELAQATGTDVGVVRGDVIEFARHAGFQGLLDGVSPPPPEGMDISLVVVPDLSVGEEVDDTGVRPLGAATGAPRELPELRELRELRGRPMLLVNWSPHCGYCWAIAELLAVLVEPLAVVGVDLVLLAGGGETDNQEVIDAVGFDGRVLLREAAPDPFRAHGTPSAYHLDADGRLLAPMANGAEAVLALASELAAVDPYALLDDPDSDPAPAGTRYLLTDGSCAPLSGDEPEIRWTGTRAYRIGDHHVGIRHDTDATAAVLDALFQDRRVRDRRAGHSYAVALRIPDAPAHDDGPAGREGVAARSASTQGLRLLVAGGRALVRSRYPSRVLRALLWRLADDIVGYDTAPGHLRVKATAAVVDGRAVLLPAHLDVFGASLQARLARAQMALVDGPFPEIDLARAELVVPTPAIDHDPAVLVGLDPPVHSGGELAPVEPGRYPLAGWGVVHPGDCGVVPFSPAEAAVATLSLVYETEDAPARVHELGDLFTRVPGFGLWYDSEAGLAEAIVQAVADPTRERPLGPR